MPGVPGAATCFNCETADGVQSYSFDMDLPTVKACKVCIFALSMGDDELLGDLRPRRGKRSAGAR